jgi:ABC-2 type transport system permease protein
MVVGPMYMLKTSVWLLPEADAVARIALSYVLALPMLMSVAAMSLMLALVTRHFTSAAILTSTVYFASYVIGSIPILSSIHPYLPTRYWPFWKFALLPDIPWHLVGQYGLWTLGYTVVFLALAAALFNLRDV